MQQIRANIHMICIYTETGLQTISACNLLIISIPVLMETREAFQALTLTLKNISFKSTIRHHLLSKQDLHCLSSKFLKRRWRAVNVDRVNPIVHGPDKKSLLILTSVYK